MPLSAKTGDGLDKLLNLIPRTVGLGDGAFDGALITNARQAAALARAAERCEAALYAAQSGMTPDAVVMDAEGAITALGEITGESFGHKPRRSLPASSATSASESDAAAAVIKRNCT